MNSDNSQAPTQANRGRKTAAVVLIAGAVIVAAAVYAWSKTTKPGMTERGITVYKTPTCGCCVDWVQHLRDSGLVVNVIDVDSTQRHRAEAGVPNTLGSCHTAVVGDYFVEGHVPADLVRTLIDTQPENIRGIAVPGMPIGSPGMEGPNPVEYDVLALDDGGRVFVYATRQGTSGEERR